MLDSLSADLNNRFKGAPLLHQTYRQKKMAEAVELGLPTRKIESWRYTPLTALSSSPMLRTLSAMDGINKNLNLNRLGDVWLLTFINGQYVESLSDQPSEVKISSLKTCLPDRFDEVKSWIEQAASKSVLERVNSAYLSEGVIIETAPKAQVSKPIQILNLITDPDHLGVFTKVFLRLAKQSSLTIIETLEGTTSGFSSVYTYGDLKEEAQLEFIRYSESQTVQVDESSFQLDRDSRLLSLNLVLTPQLNRQELNVHLNQPGASAYLNGLSIIDEKQISDNQINIEHHVPNCVSRQLYKGILSGQSKAIFAGRVFIAKGAFGSDSGQLNKNLILSRTAEVDTKPQLEVYADDVKATHGAAIGKLDPEELFYLQSRGIPKTEALSMLANAFLEDVLRNIKNAATREQIRECFLKQFSSMHVEELYGI